MILMFHIFKIINVLIMVVICNIIVLFMGGGVSSSGCPVPPWQVVIAWVLYELT